MIALEQARQHIESLGLKQAAEALDNRLDAVARKQLTYPKMLTDLLGVEMALAASVTSRTAFSKLASACYERRNTVTICTRQIGEY